MEGGASAEKRIKLEKEAKSERAREAARASRMVTSSSLRAMDNAAAECSSQELYVGVDSSLPPAVSELAVVPESIPL